MTLSEECEEDFKVIAALTPSTAQHATPIQQAQVRLAAQENRQLRSREQLCLKLIEHLRWGERNSEYPHGAMKLFTLLMTSARLGIEPTFKDIRTPHTHMTLDLIQTTALLGMADDRSFRHRCPLLLRAFLLEHRGDCTSDLYRSTGGITGPGFTVVP